MAAGLVASEEESVANYTRSFARVAGIICIVAAVVGLVLGAIQYSRRGVLDWTEVVLTLVLLGPGLYWWRRARMPDGG